MFLIGFIVKLYIIVLLLRTSMTRQELYFNPFGKIVASMTEPVYGALLKGKDKAQADKLTPVLILLIIVLYAFLFWVFSGYPFIQALFVTLDDILIFLMLFYIIAIILGSMVNTYGATVYTSFFHRMGLFWVKLARTLTGIPGNIIVLPAIILVFIAYILIDSGLWMVFNLIGQGSIDPVSSLMHVTQNGLLSIVGILRYLTWLIIIRALMSWVSPDPSNPVVQLIHSLTDPIMRPFSRLVPPIGMIDISPIILIFVIEFLRMFLSRVIGIIF